MARAFAFAGMARHSEGVSRAEGEGAVTDASADSSRTIAASDLDVARRVLEQLGYRGRDFARSLQDHRAAIHFQPSIQVEF